MEGCFQTGQGLAKGPAILIKFGDDFHAAGVTFGFGPFAALGSDAETVTNVRNEIADAGNNSFGSEFESARHEGADADKDGEFGMSAETSEQLFEALRIVLGVFYSGEARMSDQVSDDVQRNGDIGCRGDVVENEGAFEAAQERLK